jgi:hypothetical protein
MTHEINWDRLQREAAAAYAKEAERRRKLGEAATADAEELAGRSASPRDAIDQVADQSVYVYQGQVMLAHLPPSTMWSLVETPRGMELRTLLLSSTTRAYVPGPSWAPGEWNFVGRGHPGE